MLSLAFQAVEHSKPELSKASGLVCINQGWNWAQYSYDLFMLQ